MLTEEAIRGGLHASRVVPLAVANPHGPLGLGQLAAAFASIFAFREKGESHDRTDRTAAAGVERSRTRRH